MEEKDKAQIKKIMDFIKKENFKDALQVAEIMIYKGTKLVQYYLMAGYCYDKLNRLKEAENSFLEVLDINPNEDKAIKALSDLYSKQNNIEKSMKFTEMNLEFLKKKDRIKYMQSLVKLVQMYEKNEDMEKIDVVFQQLVEEEEKMSEEFVDIGRSYFQTAVTNQCFLLQKFQMMGVKGEQYRELLPSAREKLNLLMIDIVNYLYSVRLEYKMQHKDISNSIFEMKQYFPQCACFLMMILLDQLSISHSGFSPAILEEIYSFLLAIYEKADNCYLNIEALDKEMYTVIAILSYEYLAFFKEFFTFDECFNPYYEKLEQQVEELRQRKVRDEYASKISNFILKQCRNVNRMSESQSVENKLERLKSRILKLEGSYLEEVLAKMAMNCFVNYQKLESMKNLLKIRINNLSEQEVQPHLYKYYYDYLIRIARLYKSLDEQYSLQHLLSYIQANDHKDYKYHAQAQWISFSRASKSPNQQFIAQAQLSLSNIQALLPKMIGSVKSQNLRRTALLHIFLGHMEEVLDLLKLSLGTDRSFENLQSMGFFYFKQGNFGRGLQFLKEAFVINQEHYHVNRAIFISLIKTEATQDAYNFLERIYEGFPNIYWINYALGINAINNKRVSTAERYLTAALSAFTGGVNKQYKFSFEKTIQGPQFSMLYLIDQNASQILLDELIIPEQDIYQLLPFASSLFFEGQVHLKQARIQTQLGEMLKVLGRTKSSYNHLYNAYYLVSNCTSEDKAQYPLQQLTTIKQFATILFYVRAHKEAEAHLRKALTIVSELKKNSQINSTLLSKYQTEIHSLLFEVSVMRLSEMMKFQSFEAVEEYLATFTKEIKEPDSLLPSLNYFKSKYQFHILCFLHNKDYGIDKGLSTIEQFLNYFNLKASDVASNQFYNTLVSLKEEEKVLVKECIEDYYVLKYIRQFNEGHQSECISDAEVFPLIQLFPHSTVFYIVYGMSVKQNKLKIAAFLKCIQLNRESPISVDLLASLYLKQKDYLTACKLFLKSLEIDLFNPKSYIGLCNCLFVIIGSSLNKGGQQDHVTIHKALNKINSYMEFMRIVDPSENYHLLKFLKTLITDEPMDLFSLKAGLEQSRKLISHKYSNKLLYKMLDYSTKYLQECNVWSECGKQEVIRRYLADHKISSGDDCAQLGRQLLKRVGSGASEVSSILSNEMRAKVKCRLLNNVSIAAMMMAKSENAGEEEIEEFLKICKSLEEESFMDEEVSKLQKTAKDAIILSLLISSRKQKSSSKQILQKIHLLNRHLLFASVRTYKHIQQFSEHFQSMQDMINLKKYIIKSLHLDPCDPTLRKSFLVWLVGWEKKNNLNVKKVKNIVDYRVSSALEMNQDAKVDHTPRIHQKNVLLYNVGDKNAWVGFIAHRWSEKRDCQWVEALERVLQQNRKDRSRLTVSSKLKAECMAAEMIAWRMLNKSKSQEIEKMQIPRNERAEHLFNLFTSQLNNEFSSTRQIHKSSSQSLKVTYLAPFLVHKYQHDDQLCRILKKCIQVTDQVRIKNYYRLLLFISLSSKSSHTEDQLIRQLKDLLEIVSDCQSEGSVQNNSLAVMKCMLAILSLNQEQLVAELEYASENRFVTESDQILINYFQVMKAFKEVEHNHQAQGVFEDFIEYVDSMITMCKEPILKGFFISLKAMANALVNEESSKLSREVKLSLLLCPAAGKSILMGDL